MKLFLLMLTVRTRAEYLPVSRQDDGATVGVVGQLAEAGADLTKSKFVVITKFPFEVLRIFEDDKT